MTIEKIKSKKEIIKIAESLRKQGKKTVVFNGSFDILHSGHIKSLKEAKKQGDILIILLNSDKSVRSYKGSRRPINNQNSRAQTLSALECVDYVVIFNEIIPNKIISKIKPDIYCHGLDWGKNCIERKIVEKFGGKIHILKRTASTSQLIKKILDIYLKPEVKAVFLDRDGVINVNEPEYVHKIEDFKFAPGAISALLKLSKTDYKIIIVTNQFGIGRGYFKENDLKLLHDWMQKELKKNGIRIDKIYYCPHNPQKKCICRKPSPGMIQNAVKDFDISLSKSWLIGDDQKDVVLGREMNIKTIKIGRKMPKSLKLEPSYYAKNLLEAANIILQNLKNDLI